MPARATPNLSADIRATVVSCTSSSVWCHDGYRYDCRQVSGLESRLEEGDRKLGEARRAVERAEQRADRAERSLRDVETQLVDAER